MAERVFQIAARFCPMIEFLAQKIKARESMSANAPVPDPTAVRVALWRAMHVEADPPPHVLEDEIGLRLAAPEGNWRNRRDMDRNQSRRPRAMMVARARFIEDLVAEQASRGVGQYVILGAGLDSFAERRADIAARLRVFEVDQPATQAWKRRRLADLGFEIPAALRFVPVDFEADEPWRERLGAAGFEAGRQAVVASTGVAMYLTRDAIMAMLRPIAALAPGSTLVVSFMLPLALIDAEERPGRQAAAERARGEGTPFISSFTPDEMLALIHEAGFRDVRHVPAASLHERYFSGRKDGLRPSSSEDLVIAMT